MKIQLVLDLIIRGIKEFNFTTPNQYLDVPFAGGAVKAKLTGGTLPYSIIGQPNTSIAAASLSGDTISVTPVGQGSTSLTIQDSSPGAVLHSAQIVNIGIVVAAASSFTVTVSSGTTPQYSWTAGGAFIVFVERISNLGSPGWGIMCQGTSTTCITSPVTHGTIPVGTSITTNTEMTLTAGVHYRVTVYRGQLGSGFADFTP